MTFNYYQWKKELAEEDIAIMASQDRLIAGAETGYASQSSKAQMVGNIYMVNRYQLMVNKLIESNEKLGVSSDNHAIALVRATWGLAIATGVLVLATIVLVAVDLLNK